MLVLIMLVCNQKWCGEQFDCTVNLMRDFSERTISRATIPCWK